MRSPHLVNNVASLACVAATLVAGACSEASTGLSAPPNGGVVLDGGTGGTGAAGGHGGASHSGGSGGTDAAPEFYGPEHLSGTGLYSDIASKLLADDIIEYDVRYPVWLDGAEIRRFLRLPAGATIDTTDMNHWVFPVGTVAWQEVSTQGKRLNTRYSRKLATGRNGWERVAYIWNDEESDADAAPGGRSNIRGTTYDAVSSLDCELCHVGGRDGINGIGAIQLSTQEPGGSLDQFIERGLLSDPPAAGFEVPGTGVVKEALGYLHGNCGACHSKHHPLADIRTMRLRLRVEDLTPEDTRTYQTTFGYNANHYLEGTRVIVTPGSPEESQLFARMNTRDPFTQMPPIGTEVVDAHAVEIIREWIEGLDP